MVDPVHRHSNKSVLVPPRLRDLEKLAVQAMKTVGETARPEPLPRRLNRRVSPELQREIASRYEAGAETPALCVEFNLSKGGLLKLLRDQGVTLRRQPLTNGQLADAIEMYAQGRSLAAIATHFSVSYNCVRQAFVRSGIARRPRGGSYELI